MQISFLFREEENDRFYNSFGIFFLGVFFACNLIYSCRRGGDVSSSDVEMSCVPAAPPVVGVVALVHRHADQSLLSQSTPRS